MWTQRAFIWTGNKLQRGKTKKQQHCLNWDITWYKNSSVSLRVRFGGKNTFLLILGLLRMIVESAVRPNPPLAVQLE